MGARAKVGIKKLGLLVAAITAILALTATPAYALHTHLLKETFGSANQPNFKFATNLAVDPASGDLLVVDAGAQTLTRWKPNGEPAPFAALATNVIDAKRGPGGKKRAEEEPGCATESAAEPASCDETPQNAFAFRPNFGGQQISVAPPGSAAGTAGDIYVPQGSKHLVDVFASDGRFLGQLKAAGEGEHEIQLVAPWTTTVDGAGNLYVGDVEAEGQPLFKFTPTANPPRSKDLVGKIDRANNAVAGLGPTAGYIFTPGEDPSEFKSAIAKRDATSGAVSYYLHPPGENFTPGTMAVDPANGRFFGASFNLIEEYDASGASSATLLTTTKSSLKFFVSFFGVAVDGASGDIYADIEPLAGEDHILVYSPTVSIFPDVKMPASPEPTVGVTSATVHGTVNPDGAPVTGCHFEYDTTDYQEGEPPHGTSVPCDKSPAEIGSGSSPVAVQATLSGLQPGTHYFFALRAASASGSSLAVQRGTGIASFTTLAPAVTKPPTEVKGTTATFNAEVNPFGAQLEECLFEYGLTTAYGSTAPCDKTPAEIGSGTSFVAVHADVSGLTANGTTYHYRVVAKSPASPTGYGSFDGKDEHFATVHTFVVQSGEATNLGSEAATLNGTVNPGGEALTECAFEWGPTTAYGHTAPCAESLAAIGAGETPVAVHADLGGLAVGSEYHFRIVAADTGGHAPGADKSFRTLGPALLDQWAAGVVHTEATLKAEIDPGAAPTTFVVQYGETEAYGQETTPSGAGSDFSTHTVSALLEGLISGHTYHYRFLATSHCEAAHPASECTAFGPDRTLYTYPNATPSGECPNAAVRSATYLPDCRAYEMVSPPEKNGADIFSPWASSGMERAGLDQAAVDGEKITYTALAAFGDEESSLNANQYLSTRTAAGWITHGINPPHNGTLFSGNGSNFCSLYDLASPFLAFSEDLSSAWVINGSEVPIAPGAPEGFGDLYRRDNSSASYEALTIGEASFVASNSTTCAGRALGAEFRGASADLSDQLFDAEAKLLPAAAETTNRQVYDLAGGALHLVSVLPGGTPAAGGSIVGTGGGGSEGRYNGRFGSVKGAVSQNGSRVYWSSRTGPGSTTLFLRENPAAPQSALGDCALSLTTEPGKACTIAVSGAAERLTFWAADPSGSEAIYSQGEGLYRFDAASESSIPIAGESPGVLGASDGLSYLYFVSREALAVGAGAGQDNLYLDHEGTITLVAALSATDLTGKGAYAPSAIGPVLPSRDTRVSADGQLAFMSDRPLTGYDNADALTGEADMEVYLYEPGGQLRCASCNPSGARPQGQLLLQPYGLKPTELSAAAWIPTSEHETHSSYALSADGSRLFFNSFDPLLPSDTNGAQDVYEWEAPGAGGLGGCHQSDGNYFPVDGGCLSLISSGQNPQESEFVDSSTDGRDVFFRTASSFDPRDEGQLDIYDARSGGGFAPSSPPAACEGEACISPPEAPNDPTPASSSFEGAGNVVEEPAFTPTSCAKGKVRRKGHCVAKHHKRAKRSQRRAAHHKRGAGR